MKKGFTLSEILITLSIVGIVAVLTIPRVADNINKKTMVTGLQRTYDALTQAVGLMMQEERSRLISGTTLYKDDGKTVADTAGAFMKKYLKITKDCGTDYDECFAPSYKNLNGAELNDDGMPSGYYCAIVSTGASICMYPAINSNPAEVLIDVNGKAKPNISGRDLFRVYVYMDGSVADRAMSGEVDADGTNCKSNEYGSGCFNRIVKADWKMDY